MRRHLCLILVSVLGFWGREMGLCPSLAEGRFTWMIDEEVVRLARRHVPGAVECLVGRYRPLVETKARSYFVLGADRDDVVQEGMIGLCEAIRDYREDRARFRPFAELCVTRQILTAVRAARRHKHELLNDAIPTDTSASQAGIGLPNVEPLFEAAIRSLSALEQRVLHAHLLGQSYVEMSLMFSCSTKTVDNALQRARRKLSVVLLDSRSVA